MEMAADLALKAFNAVSGLLDWLVHKLAALGLPLPLWLYHVVVGLLFLLLAIWFWRWDKDKFAWPVRWICALVALVIPVAVVLKMAGLSSDIPGVNLYVLQRYNRPQQKDIVMLPYELSRHDEIQFRSDVSRSILTYAKDAGVSYNDRDIQVVVLPAEAFTRAIPYDDGDWMRLVGTEVNALSVIGVVENATDNDLLGWLNVMPHSDTFRVLPQPIEHLSYADPAFYTEIQKRWGRAVVLGIAVREYTQGLAANDRDELIAARSYFVMVQRELSGEDASLADAIGEMIARIDAVPEL